MDRIPLAVLRFHEIGMARFLKGIVLVMACGEDGKCLGVAGSLHDGRLIHFIRSPDTPGTQNGLTVQLPGAGIRGKQVIPAVSFKDVRTFQKDFISLIDILYRSDHPLFGRGVFLQNDSARIFLWNSMIRYHADHVFAAVCVVKQRGIESKVI